MSKKQSQEENPIVKVGDCINVLQYKNGQQFIGKHKHTTDDVWEVITFNGGSFSAKCKRTGQLSNFFYSNPGDVFRLVSRKARAALLKKIILDMKNQIKDYENEIEFLEKFETDEEYVAFKLDKLMTAHANSSSQEERVKSMSEILKALKESNVL